MNPPADICGYDPTSGADAFRWDGEAAAWACNFFPDCLTHSKGYSGAFTLEPWQQNIVATLAGWKRQDGTRRYREAFIAMPRKNGKTALCAGLGLYFLACDGERGPEVYCAAASRDQATLLFDPAASMVRASDLMRQQLVIHDSVKRIVDHKSRGFLRAIPAEAAQSHGFNASAVLFDELHTQPSRELYDVLKTSQGARRQPIFISITTAGHDRLSICWEVWDYARKVRDGVISDQHFLPVLHEFDAEKDDWTDKEVWRRLNPNLGVSLKEEYLEEAFQRAKEIPASENTFRNLHLNQWTEQAVRWISLDKWDKCGGEVDRLDGASCWGGLDLSSTKDLSALVLAFQLPDGDVALVPTFWIPEESAAERQRRDRVPYVQWIRDGWIRGTVGSSTDYDTIRADIVELRKRYDIRQIAIDRWNATQLAKQLTDDGIDVGFFGQGYASMSSPSKELERLVIDRQLRHGGNPVLRWMASNVAIESDAAGNIKPNKAKSTERIDGIVAAVMALGSMALSPGQAQGSLFLS